MTTREMRPGKGLIPVVLLAATGYLLPALARGGDLSLLLFFLATSIVSLDLVDIAMRVWFCSRARSRPGKPLAHDTVLRRPETLPYAIAMSVRDIAGEADRILARLESYRSHTWIIDDCSGDETALYLRDKGWRCIESEENVKKPAAIRLLLSHLPAEIETVILLDPDSAPIGDPVDDRAPLESAIRDFQISGASACCPRVRYREGNALTSLQVLECELTFGLARKGMSPHCVTSGVSIYDRKTLEKALARHSLCVYAEDLENSVILLDAGGEIQFENRLVVETDGKSTLAAWFSQRVGWSFGLARVCASRWREVTRIAARTPGTCYNFAVYLGTFTLILFPLKFVGILILALSFLNGLDQVFALDLIPDTKLTDPLYFASAYVGCAVLCVGLIVYLRPPMRPSTAVVAVSLYLFYSLANAIALGVGLLNYLSFRLCGRRIYRDHYVNEDSKLFANASTIDRETP